MTTSSTRKKDKHVINLVDAICGSGKSHALKEHFLTLKREGKRFILALPTDVLCDEVQADLDRLDIDAITLNSKYGSATSAIVSVMESNETSHSIICTHAGLVEVCKKATFDEHLQESFKQFDVFIDEVPEGHYGASAEISYDDRMSDNFPFLQWLEERDGLHYIQPDKWDDCYLYYTEKQASDDKLKQVIYSALSGMGILIKEASQTDKARYFSYTVNPVARCVEWAKSLTVSGAGVTRSDFVWWAENALQAVCVQADHLMPDVSRRTYPNKSVILKALTAEKATISTLSEVFKNHMSTVRAIVRNKAYIYTSNNDRKWEDDEYKQFTTLANKYLATDDATRLSMKSYGLNNYQDNHYAVYLGAANLDNTSISDWVQFITAHGWDAEQLMKLQNAYRNYEQAYQFVSRCGIRNFTSTEQQVYIVPDLACAEYLKEHYFPCAVIECLGLDKPRKERKPRKIETTPRNTTKGEENRAAVLSLLTQGVKQSEIVVRLGLTKGAVSKITAKLKAEGKLAA